MRGELVLSISTILGFVLTLIRVGGVFIFVPLPGVTSRPQPGTRNPARWEHHDRFVSRMAAGRGDAFRGVVPDVGAGGSRVWESASGCRWHLSPNRFSVGAQVMGLQAGYGFATVVDPNTQADSTVLVTFSQVAAGLLFFATGSTARFCVSSPAVWRPGPPARSCSRAGPPGRCWPWARPCFQHRTAAGPSHRRGSGDGRHLAGAVGPRQRATAPYHHRVSGEDDDGPGGARMAGAAVSGAATALAPNATLRAAQARSDRAVEPWRTKIKRPSNRPNGA
jgi:hypothetical protein